MKHKENKISIQRVIYIEIFILFLFVFFGGCSVFNKKIGVEDDNFAEELLEMIIQKKTCVEIDLTPLSEE